MNTIDERVNKWICHFKNLGAKIEDTGLVCMGWKNVISIWKAENYHEIAQALKIKDIHINLVGELSFKTDNIPLGKYGSEWFITLLSYQVPSFKEKYSRDYNIFSL